jgi:hypothetical protein
MLLWRISVNRFMSARVNKCLFFKFCPPAIVHFVLNRESVKINALITKIQIPAEINHWFIIPFEIDPTCLSLFFHNTPQ